MSKTLTPCKIKSKKRVDTGTKKRTYRNLVAPRRLIDDLKAITKGTKLRNCMHILYKLTNETYKKEQLISYRPLSQSFLISILGQKYYLYTNHLLENGFIERTDKFGSGLCFSYRVNLNYYKDVEGYATEKFYYNFKYNTMYEYEEAKSELTNFSDNFSKLEVPYEEMQQIIFNRVKDIGLYDYTINGDIRWDYCKSDIVELDELCQEITTHKKITKLEASNIAHQKDKALVQQKSRIVMVNPVDFITMEKHYTYISWTSAMGSLLEENLLRAKRNSTNNRLDTNLTNLPAPLFDHLLKENGMVELDLMNSQPALLSHILKTDMVQGEDIKLFHSLTNKTGFYEYMAQNTLLTRDDAKIMIFQVFFGVANGRSNLNKIFRELFPTVDNWINNYKAKNPKKGSFAILLQRLESNLFIDNIYYPLLQQGIVCFTKHDSVSFFAKDYDKVKAQIDRAFGEIEFQGCIRFTNKESKFKLPQIAA